MTNSPVTKADLEKALGPVFERLDILEESNERLEQSDEKRAKENEDMKLQIAKVSGSVETGMKSIADQGDRNTSNISKLFVEFNEKQTQIREEERKEIRTEIGKITDTLGIDGHSDNAFIMKGVMRALKTQAEIDAKLKLETPTQVRKENISLFYKILGAVIIAVGGIVGGMVINSHTDSKSQSYYEVPKNKGGGE